MHNVDKAINKLQQALLLKEAINEKEDSIKYLESIVKQDVFTKEQSRLRTKLKRRKHQLKELQAQAKAFK